MYKVGDISEVNPLAPKDFLLGDKQGDFYVIDDNGTPYARFISEAKAEAHAAILQGTYVPPEEN